MVYGRILTEELYLNTYDLPHIPSNNGLLLKLNSQLNFKMSFIENINIAYQMYTTNKHVEPKSKTYLQINIADSITWQDRKQEELFINRTVKCFCMCS